MKPCENRKSTPLRWWLSRIVPLLVILALIPILLLAGCQAKLIYFPRPYGPETEADWKLATSGITLDFQTSQGKQRAFLQGNLKSPRNLWIVCGGNGTVALDWSEWLMAHAPNEDAWLLVDFPGYGACEGSPSPRHIRESLKTAVPLAFHDLGWPEHPDAGRLRFFGHSLGSAACLLAASEFGIQRGVLISPFTSTMEMSRVVTGLPLGFLVWHRFDNAARLAEMAARGPAEVILFHGTADRAIPVTMSRSLAAGQKDNIRLREIPGGGHNAIQGTHTAEVAAALRDVAQGR